MKKTIIASLLVILIMGCTQTTENDDTQIANPAAVYCKEQGYDYQIITNPDGSQSGVCVFTDGSECDGQLYYTGECAPQQVIQTSTNVTISALDLLDDINNALSEVNNINVNDTGDTITPLTEDDLNTE